GRTGVQKTARQPEQFVAFPDGAHSGFASAQYSEFGSELQVEDVKQIQPAVSQLERRKHWIVGPENSVCCDVQLACCRTVPPKFVFARFAADKEEAFRKQLFQSLNFVVDMRCHF